MTQKQSRRTISISKELMDGLRNYAESNNRAMSDLVEQEMRKLIGMPLREMGKLRSRAAHALHKTEPRIASATLAPTLVIDSAVVKSDQISSSYIKDEDEFLEVGAVFNAMRNAAHKGVVVTVQKAVTK